MDEFLEFLRSRGQPPTATATPPAAAPSQASIFNPRTLADSLQAIAGGFTTRSSRIPDVLGASAQVADLPGLRRTVLLGSEAQKAQELGAGDSILAHEVGHIVDFTNREASGLRQELGLDREQFAELFEAAILDPRIRGPVDPAKQSIIDFIDKRINNFVARREAALAAPASSTAVAPRR